MWTTACSVRGTVLFLFISHGDCFFMGTKHTTPPTQLPMHNHRGKTYAKVGDQYVEYNDDEMYYDKHDKEKNQAELDHEAREIINEDQIKSTSKERKEERHHAEEAWKQAKREEVDDVTRMPMYIGETYQQYGEAEYGKEPRMYGGKPLGKGLEEPHYGPPLNPYYGGPGGAPPMQQDYEVPDILTGKNQDVRPDERKVFLNPHDWLNQGGVVQGGVHGNQAGFVQHNMQYLNDDYANYMKNPPRGIYTLSPLSEETNSTTETPPPYRNMYDGMRPNIAADSLQKNHGSGGWDNRIHEHKVDNTSTKHPTKRITTKRTTTTEFVPRGDVTIPNYIFNF